MRLKIYIAIALLLPFLKGYSQAKGPEAYFSYASYNTPSGSSYFETYFTISGNTVKYIKNDSSQYQSKIQISIKFSQKDSVKLSDVYNLLSQPAIDISKKPDFSAVQRYWLPKGEYDIQVKIEDKNNPTSKAVSVKGKVEIGYSADSLAISDAELIMSYSPSQHPKAYTKSGYDMVPYVYSFYPQSLKELNFYIEIYNTIKTFSDSKFVIKYFLESAETHNPITEYSSLSVYKADTVIPILGTFNIEKLPTGKYNLVVAVVDKSNKTITERGYGFYRYNPISVTASKNLDKIDIKGTFAAYISTKNDSLREDVKCLYPIANTEDRSFIDDINLHADTNLLRRFFYNFWAMHFPSDPQQGWIDYLKQVKFVNKLFSTLTKKGYMADRGRVYLQYGAPSQRDQSKINPATYPYEIWEYYQMKDGQVDKKFIFYEPSLATNDFILLHSTAIGEVQDRQWQLKLYTQTIGPYNVDQNNVEDPSGENTLDEFSNPR